MYTFQCTPDESGQHGHADGPPGGSYERWSEIPFEELRDFTTGIARQYGLRDGALVLGVRREALRKFNRGEIQHPHDRSREQMGTRFLEYHRAPKTWHVAEEAAPGRGPALGELRMIFTGEGREAAQKHVRDLFRAAGFTDDANTPAWAAGLRTWIAHSVDASFAESPALYEKRRRKRGDPASSRGGKAEVAPDAPPPPPSDADAKPGVEYKPSASGEARKRKRRRKVEGDGSEE